MSETTLEIFLAADTRERLRLVRDPASEAMLRGYFGDAGYNDYVRIARRLDRSRHLAWNHPTNLIVVPGVMGSLLESRGKSGVWWIDVRTRDHINDLGLSPDGAGDLEPANRVRAFNIDTTYEPFLVAVNERDDFGHDVFPYDWRKQLTHNTAAFRDLILKTWEDNRHQPVHLVAHSMGGLMVRAALMLHGDQLWPKLGRIVFLGTPHYGSPAIAGYLKNHLWGWELLALLGLYLSRDTFRTMWGVLGMMPAPIGIYPGTRPGESQDWESDDRDVYNHPCANFDMYRAAAWELDLDAERAVALEHVLAGAADLHRRLYEWHQTLDPEKRRRMLIIASVGYKTLFRLAYQHGLSWRFWADMEKVTDRREGNRHREGDGCVPLAAAELEDVETRYIKGVHRSLPNIPDVYREVFRWLKDEPLELPRTAKAALSQHLAGDTGTSVAPNLDGSARIVRSHDDPGVLDLAEPDERRLKELKDRLEQGQLPEFITARLLS
jgi:pimeloyl-ACP methyl ester carboxylesterase